MIAPGSPATAADILEIQAAANAAMPATAAALNALIVAGETPWSPNLQFGGASVGITTSVLYGFWWQVGPLIFYIGGIGLTSKGSSTGRAEILGLPYLPSGEGNFAVGIGYAAGLVGLTGLPYAVLKTNTPAAPGRIQLFAPSTDGGTEASRLTDANFGNVSYLYFSGWYTIA